MFQTAAKVEQLCKSWARKSADYRRSVWLVDWYRDSGVDISLANRKIVGTGDYLPDKSVKIGAIQGGFCKIPVAKICVKSPRFGRNDNVEITVGF